MPGRIVQIILGFGVLLFAGCEVYTVDEPFPTSSFCDGDSLCIADANSSSGQLSAYTVRKRGRQIICNRWSDVCPSGYSGHWPELDGCSRKSQFHVVCYWHTRFSGGNRCPQGSLVYLWNDAVKYVSSQGTRLKNDVGRSGPNDWDCIEPTAAAQGTFAQDTLFKGSQTGLTFVMTEDSPAPIAP